MTRFQKVILQIGKFHLYHAYGGVQLHQNKSEGGQIDDIFRCGFMTKRQLADKMDAFMDGIIFERNKGKQQ